MLRQGGRLRRSCGRSFGGVNDLAWRAHLLHNRRMASSAEGMITVLFLGVLGAWLVGSLGCSKTEHDGAPILCLDDSTASLAWWVLGVVSSNIPLSFFSNGSSPSFAESDAYVDRPGGELGRRVWQEG
jgi:hypothetical protein